MDNPLVSVEVLRYDIKSSKSENKGIVPTKMELVLEQTQQGTSHEVLDYIKMEMQKPRSSRVKFIATCSYSRLNNFITSRKNDPKLLQTLISTSSSICQSDENGPTPHPMITDPPPTDSTIVPAPRKKLDSEFSEEENKLEMADTQAESFYVKEGLPSTHLQQSKSNNHCKGDFGIMWRCYARISRTIPTKEGITVLMITNDFVLLETNQIKTTSKGVSTSLSILSSKPIEPHGQKDSQETGVIYKYAEKPLPSVLTPHLHLLFHYPQLLSSTTTAAVSPNDA
ncbi:hypothetical protein Tco_0178428 [Tanacetum coccineum]